MNNNQFINWISQNWIALFSLIISIITALNMFWKQRRKLSFKIKEITFADYLDDSNTGQLCIQMFFINKSQNPISINYIELFDSQGKSYICSLNPGLVAHKFQKMIDTNGTYEKFIESAQFPIYLESLSAKVEYVYFHIPIKHNITKCLIYTNRGNPIEYPEIISSISKCDHYHNGKRYDQRNYRN